MLEEQIPPTLAFNSEKGGSTLTPRGSVDRPHNENMLSINSKRSSYPSSALLLTTPITEEAEAPLVGKSWFILFSW